VKQRVRKDHLRECAKEKQVGKSFTRTNRGNKQKGTLIPSSERKTKIT
jgi:hypothetical protein